MEKSKTKVKSFFQKFHIKALFIILSVYLVLVTILYFVLRWQNVLNDQDEYYSYLDVLIYNILTIAGNDYFFDSVNASRIIGIIFLLFSMGVLSLITGYISSSMVERKLNPERVVKKMQNMKNHIFDHYKIKKDAGKIHLSEKCRAMNHKTALWRADKLEFIWMTAQ